MATYPVRADVLPLAVEDILSQVDLLFLTLNEYSAVPEWIESSPKIEASIPTEDFKDVGKFVHKPGDDDVVFFVDDDIKYPDDYVERSIYQARAIGLNDNVFGYHASTYDKDLEQGANSRRAFSFKRRNWSVEYVDQIGTGTMIALGKNVPPLAYMRGSQRFVDVRYAKWLFEKAVNLVVLPRTPRYLDERNSKNADDTAIYETFTKNSPRAVVDEIRTFAGKSPLIGKKVDKAQPWYS